MRTNPRLPAAVAMLASVSILATACTAGGSADTSTPASARQTITFWHGFTGDNEVAAINQVLAAFHRSHPNITVDAVKGQQDDQITQSIRGGHPPDVALSFTTDNVGPWCKTGAFQNLGPMIARDHLDLNQLPAVVRDYTQYKNIRCAMPLLADGYALYYNKRLLAAAGYTSPPRTVGQLAQMARRLTTFNPDGSIKVAGFLPLAQYYENIPAHWAPSWGATWVRDGRSAIARSPGWKQLLTWQKDLIDWYGFTKLDNFRQSLGQEFSADNPFEKGRVAMAIDGEWRTQMIADDHADLDYGTAPFPVADNHPELYGAGYITGTIVGIPRGAKHTAAAWELVKYLTTDTTALVTLANRIHNIPSTFPALKAATTLRADPHFSTFLKVFANPHSATTPPSPNGPGYQRTMLDFVQNQWELGKVTDLDHALADVDKRINDQLALSGN